MIAEKKGIFIILAVVFLLSFSLADCAKKPAEPGPGDQMSQTRVPEETPNTSGSVEEYTAPSGGVRPSEEPEAMMPEQAMKPAAFDVSDLVDVFFAYDRSDLTPEGKEKLADDARLLNSASGVRVIVEGHCDERGTNEYNLALGDRRANVVKNYLVSLGVSPSRIETISYGEERPFAAGHNEEAWKQNRRAHFVTK